MIGALRVIDLVCALVLALQAGSERTERVREALQAWFAAQRALPANGQMVEVDRLRGAALYRWPTGPTGEQWLRDMDIQRQVFAGCFRYPLPPRVVSELADARVRVPDSYDPARPTPTIVQVRPRGGSSAARRFGADAAVGDALVISVTPLDLQVVAQRRPLTSARVVGAAVARQALAYAPGAVVGRLWALGMGEVDDELVQQGLFSMLGILQRHYNVDRDRLIVDAASGACRPILRAATSAPDRFAGVILRAPQATQDIAVDNLAKVGVLVLRRPGGGSAVPGLERAFAAVADSRCEVYDVDALDGQQLGRWCVEQRRELMRRDVRLVMRPDGQVDGFWVSDISGDPGGNGVEGPAWIAVSADRQAARITVQTRRIERFSLLLNDELVDLDREFSLVINGVEVAMRRARSVSFLCDTVLERFDPGFLFTAAVRIDVPRRG